MEYHNPKKQKKSQCKKSAANVSPMAKAQSAADEFINDATFETDPLGSYTGYIDDEGFLPSQDADDL